MDVLCMLIGLVIGYWLCVKRRWYIVDRDFDGNWRVRSRRKLEPRPSDARPTYGDPFTPWYELKEHIHTDDDNRIIVGAHVRARSCCEAIQRAKQMYETVTAWTTVG